MRSRPSKEGLTALRNMPEVARHDLFHVVNNSLCIVRGCAEQISVDPEKTEFNQARAKTIVRAVDELSRQLKQMTTGHDDNIGALCEGKSSEGRSE